MSPEEPTDLDLAVAAARAGNAGHWPTVAAVLAAEVDRLRATVQRVEALAAATREAGLGAIALRTLEAELRGE